MDGLGFRNTQEGTNFLSKRNISKYILINASGTQVISKIITKVVSHQTDLKIERQEVI